MGHRIERRFGVAASQEVAFDYVADFSTAEEWDPGIPKASRLDDGPIGVGSRFELLSRFGKTEQTIVYEITEYERANRVVFVGDGGNFHGVDEISFSPRDEGGTIVDYVADLNLKGAAALAVPFIRGRLDQMGDHAVAGLKAALDAKGR
jgi:carbon monoxide dehydrogenase subunit G